MTERIGYGAQERFDDAVVGAGIIGLAHAYHLARRGRRVIVFERSDRAQGASVRNFGMLWPVGQPVGEMRRLALCSREHWLAVLAESGLWHEPTGSLHLAYRDDEAQVLREFLTAAPANSYEGVAWWDADAVLARAPAVRRDGLIGAMWSPSEICVDPREVIAGLPGFLAERYGVAFRFGTAVVGYENPCVLTSAGIWEADHLYVCSGDDLHMLYPEVFHGSGLVRCKLQMMRTAPVEDGWRLGPMLAAGLTLRHYKSFEGCPSLPALKQRVADEAPEYDRYGIHVMASQNGRGELVLGDSHEYGHAIEPFDKDEIDRLVLRYLNGFLTPPAGAFDIASRWHGVYVKHPEKPLLIERPDAGVTLISGLGGAGMTLSFGIAEQTVTEDLGEVGE
jgi:FAD dependent oxidoreductase TIGR03364